MLSQWWSRGTAGFKRRQRWWTDSTPRHGWRALHCIVAFGLGFAAAQLMSAVLAIAMPATGPATPMLPTTSATPFTPPPADQPHPRVVHLLSGAPYVQELDAADWQARWWGGANASSYRTVADAQCLLHHQTDTMALCPLPRTDDELVSEVHLAYSVCGTAVLELAMTSVKSFILHRHSSVALHIWLFLSPFEQQSRFFNDTMARWPIEHQPYPLSGDERSGMQLHFLDLDALMDSHPLLVQAKPHIALFKQCATIRLWLPLLLPSLVPLVLYVDCDTLVVRDYRQVVAHAQLYSPRQMLSFAYEGTSKQCGSLYFLFPLRYPQPLPYAINSGAMLLNLTRARTGEMMRLYTERLLELLQTGGGVYTMGDQDVFNRYIGEAQRNELDVFLPMPLSYNWRECTFIPPGQTGGMTLMHGNAYKFTNLKDEPFWAATYQSYYLWHKLPSNPTLPIKQ